MSERTSLADSATRASYHPKGYGVSEGLARARRPFRTRNALTGSLITLFAFSVYTYSISAVKQDDFSDLPSPNRAEASGVRTIEEEKRDKALQKEALKADFMAQQEPKKVDVAAVAANKANWWEVVRGSFGGKDSTTQLVMGAPPVDRIGNLTEERAAYPSKRIV